MFPLIPLKVNDTNDVVYSDGYLIFDKMANLVDLSSDIADGGVQMFMNNTARFAYTEDLYLESILVKITNKETSESEIILLELSNNEIVFTPASIDSCFPTCYSLGLIDIVKTLSGYSILGDYPNLELAIRIVGTIDRMLGDLRITGLFTPRSVNPDNQEIVRYPDNLDIELVAYKLHAFSGFGSTPSTEEEIKRYHEESFNKTIIETSRELIYDVLKEIDKSEEPFFQLLSKETKVVGNTFNLLQPDSFNLNFSASYRIQDVAALIVIEFTKYLAEDPIPMLVDPRFSSSLFQLKDLSFDISIPITEVQLNGLNTDVFTEVRISEDSDTGTRIATSSIDQAFIILNHILKGE